jgi:hypothetical protein
VSLHVPFDRPEVVPWLHREAEVVSAESTDEGTNVVARVDEAQLARVRPFLTEPVARRVSS